MVTDYDCWHDDHGAVDVAAVIKVLSENVDKAHRLIERLARSFPREHPPCPIGSDRALDVAIITPPRPATRPSWRSSTRWPGVCCRFGRASATHPNTTNSNCGVSGLLPAFAVSTATNGCGVSGLASGLRGLRGPGRDCGDSSGRLMARSRRLEGHAPVQRAVRTALEARLGTEAEVRVPRLADGPAAIVLPELEQRLLSRLGLPGFPRCGACGAHASPVARLRGTPRLTRATPLPCVDPQRDGASRSVPQSPFLGMDGSPPAA